MRALVLVLIFYYASSEVVQNEMIHPEFEDHVSEFGNATEWKFSASELHKLDLSHFSMEEQKQILNEKIRALKPVVFRGLYAIQNWPALRKWTPSFFEEELDTLENIMTGSLHNNSFLYYDKSRPMNIPSLKFVQPYNITSMTIRQFTKEISRKKMTYYSNSLYSTGS